MTASIGLYFVIFILAMIPLVFLGAGQDTTRQRAIRKQCRKDVLLDWTDKDALAAEHNDARTLIPRDPTRVLTRDEPCLAYDAETALRAQRKPVKSAAAVEVISRDVTGLTAA